MNMKTFLNAILLTILLGNIPAKSEPVHEWKVTLKVVDDTGQPVAGAEASVNYQTNKLIGLTDSDGEYIATHVDQSHQLAFQVQKAGYYTFGTQYLLGFNYDPSKWNPTINVVLKKTVNPIPMYARRAQIEIPVIDKPVGFDLIEYDWVAPYGHGKQSDLVFESHRRWISRNDFDSTLVVQFSHPGDGMVAVPSPPKMSSGPAVSDPAPLNNYTPEESRELRNTTSEGWKDDAKDQNFYIRIRTEMDDKGVVKSALYGKMYGDFGLDPINSKTSLILFTYYINPEPNSQNIEFDPKQNLFQNLPAMQQVKDP